MAYITILQGTPTWLPYIATDVNTGDPRTGITYNQVDVSYKKYGAAVFSVKTLVGGGTDFRENGSGVYEILFSALELDTLGTFIYVVNGNGALPSPSIKQYVGQAFIQASAAYTPGTITLPTNVLTGNLIDLAGVSLPNEAVSARILSAPVVMGSNPNIGGIGSDMVSTQTDTSGFFALEVLQGAEIDVVIPVINYRRTLTVPANSTDKLFEIP
jgi:hypothetical protein